LSNLKSSRIWQRRFLNYKISKLQNYKLHDYKEANMQLFHIRYRNAQGALMRILNAVSRRGLDLTSVHAEYAGQDHAVTLLLQVTHKQIGQLYREWYAIVDVIQVHSSEAHSSEAHSSAALPDRIGRRGRAVGARGIGLSVVTAVSAA
jgi:acetolactate synthase regulatory subunit